MATQREDIIIDVKEQGADQATSKIAKLNDTIKRTDVDAKGAVNALKGFGSSIADLTTGTGDAASSVQQLVMQTGSAASSFAQTALAASVTGSALFDLKRANEEAAKATADLAAKEKLYLEAKAARDAIRGLPRAPAGSDLAQDRAAIRQAETDAYRAMRLAQIAKEARDAEVATVTFARNFAIGLSSVAAAGALAYTGLEVIAFRARALADETDEMARKLGVTTERLQTLQYVADGGAGTVEGLTRVFDKLSKSMQMADEDNAKTTWAFKTLGVTMEEVGRMSEEQLAAKLVKNYELLGRTTKANVAIQQLLGPTFRDQIPAILELGAGVEEVTKKINDFGAVASPALVKAGQEQDDALKDLGLAWRGLSNEIAEQTGTIIQSIVSGLTTALSAIRTTLAEMRQAREERNDPVTVARMDAARAQSDMKLYEGRFGPANQAAYRQAKARYEAAIARIDAEEEKKAQTNRSAFRAMENRDAEAMRVQAAAAGAGPVPDKSTKTDPFADARESMRRSLALINTNTEYERTLFEVQEGRYKSLKTNQKEELLNLAKQIDARTALNKKAEEQLKLMEAYDQAEEEANNRLKERINYERQLATEQAKRLSQAARATRMSVGIETTSGITDTKRQEMADLANVANAAQDAIDSLSPYLENYAENVKKIRDAEKDASDAIRESSKTREKYAADWTNGAKQAFANYLEDAGNVAGKTQKLFEDSFGKAEDALLEFVTTGKFNFKSFVASILTDIARYLIQVSIMAPIIAALRSMMGFADGGVFSGGSPMPFANGAAFSGGKVTPFASGGVVNQPTLFPMTSGMGLMGEAGPEAIMPLDRDPMGRLGVKATGMGGVNNTYAISVSIGSVDSEERQAALLRGIETLIETKTKQTMANELRRGNMLNRRM